MATHARKALGQFSSSGTSQLALDAFLSRCQQSGLDSSAFWSGG